MCELQLTVGIMSCTALLTTLCVKGGTHPKQLCFPPVAGQTLRADFDGGALSSDFGPLLLRGIDRQIGLTARLAAAVHDKRHSSYIDHPLRDLFAQRIYQIASG